MIGVKKLSLAKILIATDFSPVSDRALRYATAMAGRLNAQIYLLHVLTKEENQSSLTDNAAPANSKSRREAQETIARILASGQLRGVRHEEILKEGYLWPTIDTLIRELELDLIVVGTHGLHGIKPSFGSSAEVIFRRAACPVLTVGPAAASEATTVGEFRHILFATGFGRAAGRAAPYAFFLAQTYKANLTVLHVLKPPVGSDCTESGVAALREITLIRLRESVPDEVKSLLKLEFIVRFRDPAKGILEVARETAVDLIVMGARSGRIYMNHLPDTVAFAIAVGAPCPLLTVKAD